MPGLLATSYRNLIVNSIGLVGYWRLGEATGTLAKDELGMNDGTHVNSPTPGQTGILSGSVRTSTRYERASTEHTNIADSAVLDLGDGPWSIEAWARRGENGQNHGILSKGDVAYYLRINSSNQLQLLSSGTANLADSGSVTLVSGEHWYHVAATKNGSSIALYVNGVDVTANVTNATCVDNALQLRIGADNNGGAANEAYEGWLGEVALYRRVLSLGEVGQHYQIGRGF